MKDQEYISEAHRQRWLLEKRKLSNFFLTLASIFILSVGFYIFLKPVLYTKEDKKILEVIRQYREQAMQIQDHKTRYEYLEYLKEEEKKIKDKYPFPSLWSIMRYPGNKLIFLGFSLLPAILMVGFYFYLTKKLFVEWDNFFLPTIKQEDIIKLPQKGYNLWGNRYSDVEGKYIKDVETVKRLFASVDIKEIAKAEKFIEGLIRECAVFLDQNFPYENKKEVLFCVEFLLFHHLASLYGNIPTSLLGKYVKDYNLRKALSLYQRNHLPVITGIDGRLLTHEEDAFILCKIFYTLDKHLKLRGRIDENFDPLRTV